MYPNGCLWGSTATFAAPKYADRFDGWLQWTGADCCGTTRNSSATLAAVRPGARVQVCRRGGCSFAQKARSARRWGAEALVVVDFADSRATGEELRRSVVAGGGSGGPGLVTTLLLGREAEPLLQAAEAGEAPRVELRWDLPRPVARLELWISAGDPTATELLRGLAPAARALRASLLLRPHYHVVALPLPASSSVLRRDCLDALPQFCAESLGGTAGAELLREAARQHCIRSLDGGVTGDFSPAWWSYVEVLGAACPLGPSLACSRASMATSRIDVAAVERCATERGLEFLEDDRESRAWWGGSRIVICINGWRYSGPLAAAPLLRALCRGFEAAPEACTAFLPAEEAPEGLELPAWVLTGLCIAASATVRAIRGAVAWLLPCCKRVRRKRA